jgi:hypothetical protein
LLFFITKYFTTFLLFKFIFTSLFQLMLSLKNFTLFNRKNWWKLSLRIFLNYSFN